jgi:exosortase/archaeosortase family protein
MLENSSGEGRTGKAILKFLPLFAFVVPTIILFFIDPTVFQNTWKGRIFYVFFLWLISLEMILGWDGLHPRRISGRLTWTLVLFCGFLLPTLYVIVSGGQPNYGLNALITQVSHQQGIFWADVMYLSTEYLVFTALFLIIIFVEYGFRGFKIHSISAGFLAAIGLIYTIDNVYPQGTFTPFQMFVPTTATLATKFLNLLGYKATMLGIFNNVPQVGVQIVGTHAWWNAAIAWPCSGIESLIIYSVVVLLFLKNTAIPWEHAVVYFFAGAAVTYSINVLRIVNIFVIAANGGNASAFHDTYGQLYSISWIAFYPLLILGSRMLITRSRNDALSSSQHSSRAS